MNPIMMGMLVKAKQVEIIQEDRKQVVFHESRHSSDRSESLKKLAFSLAISGVIILLVVEVSGAV